jgi:hypothetical protein
MKSEIKEIILNKNKIYFVLFLIFLLGIVKSIRLNELQNMQKTNQTLTSTKIPIYLINKINNKTIKITDKVDLDIKKLDNKLNKLSNLIESIELINNITVKGVKERKKSNDTNSNLFVTSSIRNKKQNEVK